jgi:hypothetical protein
MTGTSKLLSTNAYAEAMQWSERESEIPLGHKIRITFEGLKPKTGYAYKQEGAWLGIRYTWKSYRWWSLLNYNNPLIKLELQELDGEGNASWRTIWERESK